MTQINAYLNFNGNCREAMNFYKDCLGGDLFLQTVGESPMAAQCAAGMQDQIMHAHLAGDGFVLMASDRLKGSHQPGNNFSLTINCDSEEQIQSLFTKLADGGQVSQPLQKQFWGALFGMLTDRFGTPWMLNYEEKAPATENTNKQTVLEEQ